MCEVQNQGFWGPKGDSLGDIGGRNFKEVSNNLGGNTGVGEAIKINTNPTNTNDGSKISFARSSTVYAEICTQKMDANNNTDMSNE